MKEKRTYPRLNIPVDILIDQKGPFTTENISINGFFIPLYLDLLPFDTLNHTPTIHILIPDNNSHKVIQRTAKFVRCRYPEPSGFAYEITVVDDEYMKFCQKRLL